MDSCHQAYDTYTTPQLIASQDSVAEQSFASLPDIFLSWWPFMASRRQAYNTHTAARAKTQSQSEYWEVCPASHLDFLSFGRSFTTLQLFCHRQHSNMSAPKSCSGTGTASFLTCCWQSTQADIRVCFVVNFLPEFSVGDTLDQFSEIRDFVQIGMKLTRCLDF